MLSPTYWGYQISNRYLFQVLRNKSLKNSWGMSQSLMDFKRDVLVKTISGRWFHPNSKNMKVNWDDYIWKWKIWKSIGMMKFPIYGKIIQSCSSHHQADISGSAWHFSGPEAVAVQYFSVSTWAKAGIEREAKHLAIGRKRMLPSGYEWHSHGESPN